MTQYSKPIVLLVHARPDSSPPKGTGTGFRRIKPERPLKAQTVAAFSAVTLLTPAFCLLERFQISHHVACLRL